jgi:LuxR family maltose regulon positive regulatory protein
MAVAKRGIEPFAEPRPHMSVGKQGGGAPVTTERRVVRAVGFVPVEAKLRQPVADDALVLRGAVIDQLVDSASRPVVLITAPPGYGKTVVAQQWAHEDERPFAWLSLDESDNDPVTLLTYLMLALQRIEPVDAGVLALLNDSSRAIHDVALPRFGRTLRNRKQPFVLVLDDADALVSPEATDVVSVIARHLPEGSQLAIIGRRAPALQWSTLRAERKLVEIGAHSLRLSRPEARALIEAAGLHVSDHDVDLLVERTEGWAAGLYLATVSLSASVNQRRAVDAYVGSESVIASYLRDRVLDSLPSDDQIFLIRCAILDRMSGPLCDATLQTAGSEMTLQRLADLNMLLVRVDREGHWFRLHHLFAEALRAELHRLEPQSVTTLHARASAWLEANGDAEEAIAHGIAAGQIARTARLVWDQAGELLASGEVDKVEKWLDAFSTRQVAGHAKLSLAAAWCSLYRGRPIEHWVSAAEHGLYEADRPGESESVAAAVALLHAMQGRHGLTQVAADAGLVMRLQEPGDIWRCTALYLDALATYLTGDPIEAQAKFHEVGELAVAFNAHSALVAAQTQLAIIAIEVNDWHTAEQLHEISTTTLREQRLEQVPFLITTHCVSALLAARNGDDDDARARARRCISLVALTRVPPAVGVQCRYLLARAQLILGDAPAARVLLSEALSGLSSLTDAVLLRDQVEKTWRQIQTMSLGFERGASTLTTAELRVLQYLPTHLSFEQIGKELFVSRNTVKSQAIAAYRKLGVTSRTEAVERAQALGLLVERAQALGLLGR